MNRLAGISLAILVCLGALLDAQPAQASTKTAVPEWNGQEVYVMQEDPAYLTTEGWRFFRPRT